MSRYNLGLLLAGKNPSACLIKDSEIVAFVEEERFTRIKHADNSFPIHSINYCLKNSKIALDQMDSISVGWDSNKFDSGYMSDFFKKSRTKYGITSSHALEWQDDKLRKYTTKVLMEVIHNHLGEGIPPVEFHPHHLCHAYSTYFLSGMDNANILTFDGHGEEDCSVIWHAKGEDIQKIKQIDIPNSLGWFYTIFTKFLGFRPHDGEGKTMGLAAYGSPNTDIKKKMSEVVTIDDNGYKLNPDIFYGERHDIHTGFTKKLIDLFGNPHIHAPGTTFTPYHKDLAYEVQDSLERAILIMAKNANKITGSRNFCLAGGTFMNCKTNGFLAKQDFVNDLFVIPTSADNGISLGAALISASKRGYAVRNRLTHVNFGPEFDNLNIEEGLRKFTSHIDYKRVDDIPKLVANLVNKSKIVAWFQGRMEVGARALGNRSIIANPLDPNAKDIVNSRVKFREMWRPFCPSVIEEKTNEYFDIRYPSQFMIIAADAKDGVEELLPSVVHADNTVRPQEVSKETNPRYWEMIYEFGNLTGHPVVLNTSFNVKGEPIICNPTEAVECLLKTDLDFLAIGDFLVWKKGVSYEP